MFQAPAGLAAELGEGTAQVIRSEWAGGDELGKVRDDTSVRTCRRLTRRMTLPREGYAKPMGGSANSPNLRNSTR